MAWLDDALLAIGLVACLVGVISYLRMVRTVPLEVARLHAERLRIRESLLCFAAPELYTGRGATYRRRYIAALVVFVATAVAAAALGGP